MRETLPERLHETSVVGRRSAGSVTHPPGVPDGHGWEGWHPEDRGVVLGRPVRPGSPRPAPCLVVHLQAWL